MRDLGVELHAEEAARRVAHGGDRAVLGLSVDAEAGREARHGVAVAHPHDRVARDALEDLGGGGDLDGLAAELALVGARDLAAELARDPLHAVADAEHRHSELEETARDRGRIRGVHGCGTAGEDDRSEVHRTRDLERAPRRRDLAVAPRLAHATRDQLRVLRTEVDDQDTLGLCVHSCDTK